MAFINPSATPASTQPQLQQQQTAAAQLYAQQQAAAAAAPPAPGANGPDGGVWSDPEAYQRNVAQNEHTMRSNAYDPNYKPLTQAEIDANTAKANSIQSQYNAQQAAEHLGTQYTIDTNALRRDTTPQQQMYDNFGAKGMAWNPADANYANANLQAAHQSNLLGQGSAALNQSAQFRGSQLDNIRYLQNMQAGRTPSVAELQLQAGTDRAIAGGNSIAAGARGGNIAGAQWLAQSNAAQQMGDLNQQQAILRAQEQQAATGMLGDATTAGRLGDAQAAQQYGMLGQQYGDRAEFQAGLEQWDLDQQMREESQRNLNASQWYNMGNAQRDAQYAATSGAEQARLGAVMEQQRINQGVAGNSSLAPALIQGGATVVGSVIGAYAGGAGAAPGAAAGAAGGAAINKGLGYT